jgi:hypothetical protein
MLASKRKSRLGDYCPRMRDKELQRVPFAGSVLKYYELSNGE